MAILIFSRFIFSENLSKFDSRQNFLVFQRSPVITIILTIVFYIPTFLQPPAMNFRAIGFFTIFLTSGFEISTFKVPLLGEKRPSVNGETFCKAVR